jgi:hypothetical protein
MAQGVYREIPLAGVPGKDFDGSGRISTYINNDPKAKQIVDVVASASVEGVNYFVTISGVTVGYVAQSGDGLPEVADGLEAAINGEPILAGILLAESNGVNTVTLTALYGGQGYSVTNLQVGLAASVVQANATADPVPFGRVVISVDGDGRDQLCRLAKAISLAKQSALFEVSEGIDGEAIRLKVEHDGNLFVAEHVYASGQTANDVTDALEAAFNLLGAPITAVADGDELKIEVDVAGDQFKIVSFSNELKLESQTAGDDINDLALGITLQSFNVENGIYPGGRPMAIKDDSGRVFVETEDAASLHKKVYVRLAANGGFDKLGGFRATPAPGCVLLKNAKWHRVFDSNLAVVQF